MKSKHNLLINSVTLGKDYRGISIRLANRLVPELAIVNMFLRRPSGAYNKISINAGVKFNRLLQIVELK